MNIVSGAVRALSSSLVFVFAVVFSSATLAAQIDPAALAKLSGKVAQGEPVKLIIRLKDVPSAKAPDASTRAALRSAISGKQKALLMRHGGWIKAVKRYRETPYVALETDQTGLSALLADADIASVEEDIPLELSLNDTPAITGADLAWNAGYRGAGQAVAILDTGVDTAHPFFAGKIAAEACFSQNSTSTTSLCPNGQDSQIGPGSGIPCNDPNFSCWHGTHVAGIAAGKSGILSGAGMAPDAKIIPIQVFTRSCASDGSCSMLTYTSDIGLALDHVHQLSVTIPIASVNMSLGGDSFLSACDSQSPSLKELIDLLRNANIATIAASGNNGTSNAINFPACISSAVSVGSTTKQNAVASYSNSSAQLALLAPGSSIYSSVPGGSFGTASGTSMATPHVAGVWALMKSAKPSATVSEILTALQTTGLPITDSRNGLARPLVQVGGSTGAIANMVGVANQAPTATLTSPVNNASFTAPATITLTASASDADGSVSRVEFYQGTSLIGTDNNGADGWSITWNAVPVGSYSLSAKAFDDAGAATTSTGILVNVTAASGGSETVWVDDAVPSGATLAGTAEGWNWVSAPLYSGSLAHASGLVSGAHQHYFYNARTTLSVQPGDTLFAYVYLDPANPPSEVMLQWNDGGWSARAYWGANLIGWGTNGTASRRYMGSLPATGRWVRLEVPASVVGLEGKTLKGMAFTLYNGKATWDKAGRTNLAGANVSPTVSLTNPANNAGFTAPATITLTASASDADGSVSRVEFYQGTSLIGTDNNGADGWSVSWTQVPAGNYTLIAKAFDDDGASTASAGVSIGVSAPGGLPTLGLVAHYTFDENSGAMATDASGYNNHASVLNGASWVAGRVNGALSFDGVNDGLSLANLASLNPGNTPHTIAAWIRIDSLPGRRAWVLLLGKEGTGAHHWLLNSNGVSQLGSWSGKQATPTLPAGVWKHIALTFDGSTLKAYIDGTLVTTTPASFNLASLPLTAASGHLGENYFHGALDELRIYNRGLSGSEIASLASQ